MTWQLAPRADAYWVFWLLWSTAALLLYVMIAAGIYSAALYGRLRIAGNSKWAEHHRDRGTCPSWKCSSCSDDVTWATACGLLWPVTLVGELIANIAALGFWIGAPKKPKPKIPTVRVIEKDR